jgi:hypothetical protein
MGQFSLIFAQPPGVPMLDWINSIPNDGLIYYRGMFNADRLIPTNAKTLSEILTLKSYDFVKPSRVRAAIGRVLGFGLVLAEGEEHKVWIPSRCLALATLLRWDLETTKEPHASVCIPSYQGSVPKLLEERSPND